MSVTFELPGEMERNLRRELGDLDRAAKEAALVELYRQRKVTHHELAEALGLSRFTVEELLKRHGANYELTAEEIARESESLRVS